jgi:hypothetical protein
MNARAPLHCGIVPGMPNAEYHAGPGVSCSMLGDMAKSPAHCWALHHDPDRPAREASAAMVLGTLVHAYVLEPDEVGQRYATRPEGLSMATKDGKAWAAQVPAGIEIVSHEQALAAQRCRAAVLAVPELAALLSEGAAEQSAYWTDEATGLLCRCRPDWVHPLLDGRVILLDLKTTTDASPEAFARSVWNFGYHRQAAWYSAGYAKASGKEVAGFVFGTVTSAWPHLAAAYMLDDTAMERGAADCGRLLAQYAVCQASGQWPGYPAGVNLLSLPAWAK